MCIAFNIRVAHFFGMLKKEKYLHEISMFTFTKKVFSEAYLIWVPKLDVPQNGIPLFKWT